MPARVEIRDDSHNLVNEFKLNDIFEDLFIVLNNAQFENQLNNSHRLFRRSIQ